MTAKSKNRGPLLGRVGARFGWFIARHHADYAYVPRSRVWKPGKYLTEGSGRFEPLAEGVVAAGRTLLGYDRLFVLWQAVWNTRGLAGAGAEVGTYRGGSAYFLAKARREAAGGDFDLHVFDTFTGHPAAADPHADPYHPPGMFADTSLEEVRAYLSPFPRVQIHPGEFPETAQGLADDRFAVVHLDVDLHRTTLDGLEHFAARLLLGGVIVVDDYGSRKCPGVAQAVHEFLPAHAELSAWRMGTEQIVLIRNA